MPEWLKRLINSISYLPWIWEKTATKLALFLLKANTSYIDVFADNLKWLRQNISFCKNCFSLCDRNKDLCAICNDFNRDKSTIAVVEEYLDQVAIEDSWAYNWLYHILGWAISPINWVFIWDLHFKELFERIINSETKVEIVLATNPNLEWEATASYIIEEIKKRWLSYKVEISRLSRWLSSWYIEYADNITLINALKERKKV